MPNQVPLNTMMQQPTLPLSASPPLPTQPDQKDPSWYRQDKSLKGMGFFGPLKFKDGKTSTELSVGVNIGGKETEIPALVPTLTKQEIDHLLGGNKPTPEIIQKAVDHAMQRLKAGLPVFATDADKPLPIPQ